MDADELLARQLQAEEDRAAQLAPAQGQRLSSAAKQQQFAQRLASGVSTVQKYEDELAQALALSVLPKLAADGDASPPDHAAWARKLLAWFKHFFSWVDALPCERCGGATTVRGSTAPTAEDASAGAGRVEMHFCNRCSANTRFPRYNDPVKLLETRRGRCGEWANCFALCCRAAGLEIRYVMDWTDHVWVEFFCPSEQCWVHLDPCEGVFNQPLLYEAGWGKALTYIVAFHRAGVADTTRRYTADFAKLAPRRTEVPEVWLAGACAAITARLRIDVSEAERKALADQDAAEAVALGAAAPAAAAEALSGRQTGLEAWRAARGELGARTAPAGGSASPPIAPMSLAEETLAMLGGVTLGPNGAAPAVAPAAVIPGAVLAALDSSGAPAPVAASAPVSSPAPRSTPAPAPAPCD